MKRTRLGHLALLMVVGMHVTQAIYYARMAVGIMENEDRAPAAAVSDPPAAEPEPAG